MTENFSMGVMPSSYTLSTLNFSEKALSEQDNKIVVIEAVGYIFAYRSNVLAPSVRV